MHFHENKMQLALICFISSSLLTIFVASENATTLAKPGCPSSCGNVTVPYPFGVGIGTNCSLNSWFNIYCDTSVNPPSMLLASSNGYHVIDFSISNIRVKMPNFSSRCYNNESAGKSSNLTLDLSTGPYSLSETNMLTLFGCSDIIIMKGNSPSVEENNFVSGCISLCSNGNGSSTNGSCPGNGCCQIPVPKGTVVLNASISSLQDPLGNMAGGNVKPCSYSFLGEKDSFSFGRMSNLYKPPLLVEDWLGTVPVNLDWRIGAENCSAASLLSSYACRVNSSCIDAEAGGYRCRCVQGYEGNPYLPHGCIDIDECSDRSTNECEEMCINTPGSYNCSCPTNSFGDGMLNGTGCYILPGSIPELIPERKLSQVTVIGLVSGTSLLVLLLLSFGLVKFVKKKRKQMRRRKFFKENGGLLLLQETSTNEGILRKTKIFTAKELEKSSDLFNESRILGQGGQGTVYKGMLSNGQIVAIKKSKLVDERKSKLVVEQFINEVAILSLVNHKNVVKLLGCCLETRIPLLVYEFMPNGTLSDLIHGENIEFPFTWAMRLKIAADVAGAIAYLHTATSTPIFHRDVKSCNILLDEKFIAKISDFGTSKSVEVDQTHLTTMVNGTFGYIDPEYFRSSQFTEKSDVYSFGVVLIELLTGLKPIIVSTNPEDDKSLVSRFLSMMKDNNLELILEDRVSGEGEKSEIAAVAELAKRCLHLNGKKRPYMKEVAMALEVVRKSQMKINDTTEIAEDYSTIENFEYGWSHTSDFCSTSSSTASLLQEIGSYLA